ncbi:MAG: hypothetical protein M1818_001094 [Claussenomyces sp. TS43310]|nr:MAG: hypothetical protein M1818_001094 [Claussenomyces sp. TS43310]
MTKYNIEIVSDNVCPWCYVGKKKLEMAIKEHQARHGGEDTFSTAFMPFYLNPDAPQMGVDKRSSYEERFGRERTEMISSRLSQIGRSVGIDFKFGGKTGNTRNSHRLVQLGKTKSPVVQTKIVEALFAAYFEDEQDITSIDVLKQAGVAAGLDAREVDDWLRSDQGGREVDTEVLNATKQHITGVPNFTVNGQYEVGGAQDPAVFLKLFERIKASEASQPIKAAANAVSC